MLIFWGLRAAGNKGNERHCMSLHLTLSSIGTLVTSSWLSSGTGTLATESPFSAANIKGLFWASRPAIFCFSRFFWQEKARFHLCVIIYNASKMLECFFNLQNLQLSGQGMQMITISIVNSNTTSILPVTPQRPAPTWAQNFNFKAAIPVCNSVYVPLKDIQIQSWAFSCKHDAERRTHKASPWCIKVALP